MFRNFLSFVNGDHEEGITGMTVLNDTAERYPYSDLKILLNQQFSYPERLPFSNPESGLFTARIDCR